MHLQHASFYRFRFYIMNETCNGTSVHERYPVYASFMEAFNPFVLTMDRYVMPLWYIIGVITNPISVKIWLSKQMRLKNSSAIYLAALSISDFVYVLLHFNFYLSYAWGLPVYARPGACEIFNFLFMTPQYLTPLLVLGFTIERYIAVCHPFKKEIYCTVSRAVKVVIGLVSFSIALGLFQAYFWTWSNKRQQCDIREEEFGDRSLYSIWSWVSDFVMFGGIPLAVLVVNILVLRDIKQLNARASVAHMPTGGNSAASTVTLLSVSFYLILTTLPVTLVFTMQNAKSLAPGRMCLTDDEIRIDSQWNRYFTFQSIRKVVDVVCFSHYCCYLLVYVATGKLFRLVLMDMCSCIKCKLFGDKHSGKYSAVVNGKSSDSCTTGL